MSASSSLSSRSSARPVRTHRRPMAAAVLSETPDDTELARRLLSLISLLGIYAVGLLLVTLVSDGPDIGVLLAALLAHAIFISCRSTVRVLQGRHSVVSATRRGIVVVARRARLIRYADIARAASHDGVLRLQLRSAGDMTLRWVAPAGDGGPGVPAHGAILDRVFVRMRTVAAQAAAANAVAPVPAAPLPAPVAVRASVAALAARRLPAEGSLTRVAASLRQLATAPSSVQVPVAG